MGAPPADRQVPTGAFAAVGIVWVGLRPEGKEEKGFLGSRNSLWAKARKLGAGRFHQYQICAIRSLISDLWFKAPDTS